MEQHSARLLRAFRASIARAALDALPPATLGEITLRDDQRLLVSRAERVLRRRGGCIVADEVGRGKTFVALALAHRIARPLVVVPSPLVDAWTGAMARTGVHGALTTHGALSRRVAPPDDYGVIIVDESHHFRNTGIRRYDALAKLAAKRPLILLSATPLQNSARDLAAQIALFWGDAAFELTLEQLTTFLVRGDDLVQSGPAVEPPRWIPIPADDSALLDAVLALPDPVRPRDSGDEGALRTIGLVRAWASSRAALQSRVRRRRQLAVALEQGLAEGILPSRREVRSWSAIEDTVQLGLTSLLVSGAASADAGAIAEHLDVESAALAELARLLALAPDVDGCRVSALLEVRRAHAGQRILVFSEFASTIRAFYQRLRHQPGVGMLCSHEGQIASGRIARAELLRRFAPIAQGGDPSRAHHQVTLLLATDLLSEGLDLQDANVVVHLDLPWNPARLTQRLGRVRRPGCAGVVHSYLFTPPAPAAALLRVEDRLRAKDTTAAEALGARSEAMPALTSNGLANLLAANTPSEANAAIQGAIMQRISPWRLPEGEEFTAPLHLSVESEADGWLACMSDGRLAAGGMLVSTALGLLQAAQRCTVVDEGSPRLAGIREWCGADRQNGLLGLDAPLGRYRREALARLARRYRQLPKGRQAGCIHAVSQLRAALLGGLPLKCEQAILQVLADTGRPFPEAIAGLAAMFAARKSVRDSDPTLVAGVVFQYPAE